MEPIIIINVIRNDNEKTLKYRITVSERSDLIQSSDSLIQWLNDSIPGKKGIIGVTQISDNIWEIETNKF